MYDIWLLVTGGCDASWTDLATVELYNTSTNQWLAASSLPVPCGYLTSAIVDDYGYFITDSQQVFRVSLPDIVSHTVDQSTASKSPALWCRLPDTPLKNSAAFSLHSYLIAVGGSHDNHTRQTSIYTSRRVSNGLRLETYLMHASIVPVWCYPAVSCWLLEDLRALSDGVHELMWHLF